jgi:hypothetical protein
VSTEIDMAEDYSMPHHGRLIVVVTVTVVALLALAAALGWAAGW